MKVKAHIPCQQYGFFEIEGTDAEIKKIEALYNQYAETPLTFGKGVFKELDTFTGEKIRYNEETHQYTDLDLNKLISGSEYSRSKQKKFDKKLISGLVGKKYGVDKDIISDMWDGNSLISSTFGTALHLAMEHWFKHRANGTEKKYHLPKPLYLRTAVESFPLKDENIIPEVLISDVANKMVGQIDGLQITGEKQAIIIDYKSDSEVEKNLEHHAHQLSFYQKILENKGWTIEGREIWSYVDDWKSYPVEYKEV